MGKACSDGSRSHGKESTENELVGTVILRRLGKAQCGSSSIGMHPYSYLLSNCASSCSARDSSRAPVMFGDSAF